MPTPAKLNSMRQRRTNCIGNIKTMESDIEQYKQAEELDVCLLKKYQTQLEEEWKRFRLAHDELNEHGEEDVAVEREALRIYVALGARLERLILAEQPSTQSTPVSTPSGDSYTTSNTVAIKLPDLRLPTFDGSLDKWSTFYDTFLSTIDQNPSLTDIQKFHYLQSAVQGEAADCLHALPLNNMNYSEAMAVLKESFASPRYVAFSHGMAIIDYPKLNNESPRELKRLVHTIKQHIYALNKLGQSSPDTSAIINCLILSKLPLSIQKQWQMALPNKEVPSYSHLLDFLEKLAQSSKPITTARQSGVSSEQTIPVRQRVPRGQVFTTTQVTPACPTCQGQHPVWRCDSFKAKTASKRLKDATRASLCLNCLKTGHTARDCHASSCRTCGGRHHTMLHQEKQPSRSNSSTSSRSPSSSSRRTTSPPSPTNTRKTSNKHKSGTTRTNSPPIPPDSPRRTRTHRQ
ncbi:uncharacterized protein [Bombus flavifrons]|uniref:uncharacterized protein n=1 Tax=Bombus flavifrons TaxID=103934 RepID=UPI00370371A8